MSVPGASDAIRKAVLDWPDTEAHPHRFGGTEYRLGRREIGHIHGDWLVDVPFPKKIRDKVVDESHAEPHHLLKDSGWVSLYLRTPEDIQRAIDLFRSSYEIAMRQRERRGEASPVR